LKFNALVEAIHDFDFHTVRSEPEALLLESKLIKDFKPRYNVSFRDDKRFLMLKVNLNDPIPNFTFTRLKKDDGARYFGPFVNSLALRNTVALARRQFNLRGCRVFTPGAADYKHCLYAHLKHCTAPCVGNVTQAQYLDQVRAACDFLEGQCREMQTTLEADMRKAAAAQDYEKAADLRDLLRDLEQTWQRTEKFERVPYTLPVAIHPENDLVELGQLLGLPSAPQRIEGFDISNISGTFAVASLVSFRNGRPDRGNYRRFRIKSVTGQDDFASIAEAVQRRYTRLQREHQPLPDLILIDGGRGQLNMAVAELKKLGLEHLPVIGLAKEFEEIYLPDKSLPLRPGLTHPAVKLLQRVRDECHRVANSYNAQLRLRKISESILDEFPGIGERRKAALLKKFGSVQRLKLATQEQIAEVSGFGGKAAAELKQFLEARTVAPEAEKAKG
jgi:excinuclease ABC subunit C